MSAVSSATGALSQKQTAAVPLKNESAGSRLFDERIAAGNTAAETILAGAPSLERFQERVEEILRLKGEREWIALVGEKASAKAMGEFFKFVETTAKAIVHNQNIDEESLPLALEMIQFLANDVCQSSPALMWNLWLFRETKSDLRDTINFILSEILGVDEEHFERVQQSVLEERKQIDRKSFFELVCGTGGFASLYQNEYLITLDPIQILLFLALAYPKEKKQESSLPSTELRHRRPAQQQPPRATLVKPLNRDENGPCSNILPIVGGIAAVVFALYAMS